MNTILLVEDNEEDITAMRQALTLANITNPLQVTTDGQAALDYLSGVGIYKNRENFPLPFIMFLDLKLPDVHGFEILAWIRNRPALQSIVVVVLTSRRETWDQDRAYALGARTYLVKPPTARRVTAVMRALDASWINKTGISPISKQL